MTVEDNLADNIREQFYALQSQVEGLRERVEKLEYWAGGPPLAPALDLIEHSVENTERRVERLESALDVATFVHDKCHGKHRHIQMVAGEMEQRLVALEGELFRLRDMVDHSRDHEQYAPSEETVASLRERVEKLESRGSAPGSARDRDSAARPEEPPVSAEPPDPPASSRGPDCGRSVEERLGDLEEWRRAEHAGRGTYGIPPRGPDYSGICPIHGAWTSFSGPMCPTPHTATSNWPATSPTIFPPNTAPSPAAEEKCSWCEHPKEHHIYHEGACRGGYVCEDGCVQFIAQSNRNDGGVVQSARTADSKPADLGSSPSDPATPPESAAPRQASPYGFGEMPPESAAPRRHYIDYGGGNEGYEDCHDPRCLLKHVPATAESGEGCDVQPAMSRMCQRGTKGCIIDHPAPAGEAGKITMHRGHDWWSPCRQHPHACTVTEHAAFIRLTPAVEAALAGAEQADYLTECLHGISHWSACRRNAISNPDTEFVCLRCQLEDSEKQARKDRAAIERVEKCANDFSVSAVQWEAWLGKKMLQVLRGEEGAP